MTRFLRWLGFRARAQEVSAIWLQQYHQDAHKGGIEQSTFDWDVFRKEQAPS